MVHARTQLGRRGEEIAAHFLASQGLSIVARNCFTRSGELDLVAKDGQELVFVEVKTRRSRSFGAAEESITPAKRRRLWLAAVSFLDRHCVPRRSIRFDVVIVDYVDPRPDGEPGIRHYRNAFGPGGQLA